MSKGTFYVRKGDRTFYVEPISKHANRNADWNNGIKQEDLPIGGAIHPDDSVIGTVVNGREIEHLATLQPGESPLDYIDRICNEEI